MNKKNITLLFGLILILGALGYFAIQFSKNTQVQTNINDTESSNSAKKMHSSWDKNSDGINDCETDGTCDDSFDYSAERPEESKPNDLTLQTKLIAGATYTLPDTDIKVSISGIDTPFGDAVNSPDQPHGGTRVGNIVMPYPYEKGELGGKDVVTTLTVNYGGSGNFSYLIIFTPGEAMWQEVDKVELGSQIEVQDLKVVGNKITVVYNELAQGQAQAEKPANSIVKSYTLEGSKLVETQN